jgi:hypothetical protein
MKSAIRFTLVVVALAAGMMGATRADAGFTGYGYGFHGYGGPGPGYGYRPAYYGGGPQFGYNYNYNFRYGNLYGGSVIGPGGHSATYFGSASRAGATNFWFSR